MEWTDSVKPFDLDAITSIDLGELQQPWDGERDIAGGTPASRRADGPGYHAPHVKRTAQDLRPINRAAVQHIATLPPEGHSYHYLISAAVTLWDVVPAMLDKLAPQHIKALYISTLTFGAATANDLLALVDIGKIERVTFIVSDVFRAQNGQLFDSLIPHLLQRGQHAASDRTHAKVLAIEWSNGSRFVIESSSNLRSSKSIEQVAIIRDSGLYEFHRNWIGAAVQEGMARQKVES